MSGRLQRRSVLISRALVCLVFAAGLSCPALGTEDLPKAKVKLRLWKIPRSGSRDILRRARRAAYDAFIESHPHIEVVPLLLRDLQGPVGGGAEFLAVAGGVAPDAWFLTARKIGDYQEQNLLAPLNKYLADYHKRHGAPYQGIGAPADMWRATYKDGKIYNVPGGYNAHGLRVDRALALQAGLPADEGPRDWEDLYRWARKMTRLEKQEGERWKENDVPSYGLELWGGVHKGYQLCQFTWSAGGDVIRSYIRDSEGKLHPAPPEPVDLGSLGIEPTDRADYERRAEEQREETRRQGLPENRPDSDLVWRTTIDEEPGVAALRFIQRLRFSRWLRCYGPGHEEPVEFDLDREAESGGKARCPEGGRVYDIHGADADLVYTGVAYFEEGRSFQYTRPRMAMAIIAIGDVWDPGTEPWVMVPFPSRKGKPLASHIKCHYLGISATAPPEVQDAAWEYIEFITGPEARRVAVRKMVESGAAFGVRPRLLLEFGYEDLYRRLPKSWVALNEQLYEAARWEPTAPGFQHTQLREFTMPMDAVFQDPGVDPAIPLAACAKRVNQHVMGKPSEEEIQTKERIGWVILVAVVFVLALVVRKMMARTWTTQQAADSEGYGVRGSRRRRELTAWAFLFVAVASVLLWRYVPLMRGLVMAFQDYKITEGIRSRFVGLDHFVNMFYRLEFYRYLLQTFWYLFLSLAMGFFTPIVLAVLLDEIPRGKLLFRIVYYLPAVTTGVVTMFLWKNLFFDPTDEGILNQFLALFGIGTQKFLESPRLAMVCIVLPAVWAGAGPGCLIYLAALKNVPKEQYEAADIDGAGLVHKVRYVLIPNLSALIIINLVGAVVGAFHASENVFLMTGGGPLDKTVTIGLDIWMNSFMFLNFGFATAEAWIMGALLIGFTLYQLQILSRVQFKGGGAEA